MNNFTWTKAIFLGILVWLIMFSLVSGLVGFKVYDFAAVQFLIALFSGVVAYFASAGLHAKSAGQAFFSGAVWLAVGMVLDLAITARFNASIYSSWQYWLSYLLVMSAPWVYMETRRAVDRRPHNIF